jgi:hypothetical protein
MKFPSLTASAVVIGVVIFAVGTAVGFFLSKGGPTLTGTSSTANAISGPRTATTRSEPKVLFGIAMDQPLALPECKKSDVEYLETNDPSLAMYHGSVTCFIKYERSKAEEVKADAEADPAFRSRRNYSIKIPSSVKPSYAEEVSVSTLHDRVAEIEIDTAGQAGQDDALADLTRKFGNPTSQNSKILHNGLGAQIEGVDAFWNFANQGVTIEFDGIGDSPDKGYITVHNRDFTNATKNYDARHPSPHL